LVAEVQLGIGLADTDGEAGVRVPPLVPRVRHPKPVFYLVFRLDTQK